VVDFYRTFVTGGVTSKDELRLSRWITVLWGLVLVFLAILSRGVQSVLEAGLTIASITYGSHAGRIPARRPDPEG